MKHLINRVAPNCLVVTFDFCQVAKTGGSPLKTSHIAYLGFIEYYDYNENQLNPHRRH